MFSKLSRHISYANVAATLALVFSMSGAALAAHHYLISSTKQISPKVLKSLKGNSGPKGSTGPAGAAGTAGAKGETGERGPSHAYSATGISNATVHLPLGTYAVVGSGTLEVEDTEAGPGMGACAINDQGTPLDGAEATVPDNGAEFLGGTFGHATISNEATVTVTSGENGLVGEDCEQAQYGILGASSKPVSVQHTAITATQVGGLN